ncbi:alpha-amylase family protein [Nocardia carnea]|uniref:alpha-amylase family protein n=1 Tax=Nocardia carnea TaxID=37328 RepID=UPI002457A1A3|nr:alpha-amylase family protein [Nocardia carnea]
MSVSTAHGTHSRWQQPFTVFQTNLQDIDATMDVAAALDVIERHGADTWLLNAGGITAFYPTDLEYHTRNPFLDQRPSGDLLGDAVTAANKRGIRVLARLDLSKVSAETAARHPDWLFVSHSGQPQIYQGLYSTCPSGEYYQQRTLEILDEILDRYPVDGFFFNWFNFNERDYGQVIHGVCHCASCLQGFAEMSGGEPLPDDHRSPSLLQWRRYTETTLAGLARKYNHHTATRDRDLAMILRKGAPIVYHEGNNAFLQMPGKDFWPHATAEAVSAHISARPDTPLVLNTVAHIDSTYRMGAEQPEHVAQHLIQAIGRGGNPSTYILGAPGRLPMTSVSLAQDVTRFHRAQHELYAALHPAASIALVRPGARGASGAYLDSIEEFRGVYLALQERHLPFDVLPIDDVTTPAIDRYRLIVLPGVGSIGPDTATVLDDFVRRGGNLLTTGTSGVTAEGTVELTSSPALRRIGTALSGPDLWSTYATLDEQPKATAFHYEGSIVPIFGANARYVWKPAATTTGQILAQAPWGPPELAYGHRTSGEPAVAAARFGAGVHSMIPWTVGRTYREFGKTEVRDHLVRVLEPLAGHTVSADLPEQAELILGRDDTGLVAHILNHTGAGRRSFGPHIPLSGGRLFLHGANRESRATALVAGRELSTRRAESSLVVELPVIELFEVVRVVAPGSATPTGR